MDLQIRSRSRWSTALSTVALYGANAVGALGQLAAIHFVMGWSGVSGYARVSLYFMAFAVPLAFEPAVVRKAMNLSGEQDGDAKVDALLVAWTTAAIVVGTVIAIALGSAVFSASMGLWSAVGLLMIGAVDYALGVSLLRMSVRLGRAGDQRRLALISFVQNLSRYGFLLILLFAGDGSLGFLALLPLRRLVEFAVLRASVVPLRWPAAGSWRLLWSAMVDFGATIGVLLLGTEGVGVLVYLVFGDHQFGSYRAAFDLASKLWFVTTIFPLVLYPRLRVLGLGPRTLLILRKVFAWSWLAYLVIALVGFLVAPLLFRLFFPKLVGTEFVFFLVLMGVAITAHARLALECLQAFGFHRTATSSAIAFVVVMLAVFLALGSRPAAAAIGGAWIGGGLALAMLVDSRVLLASGAGLSHVSLALLRMLLMAAFVFGAGFMINSAVGHA